MPYSKNLKWIPLAAAVVAIVAIGTWRLQQPARQPELRVPQSPPPGTRDAQTPEGNPVLQGQLLRSGKPSGEPLGDWPQFRGPERNGRSDESVPLLRQWPSEGPRRLWSVSLGEGYAGAAIQNGRVYVMDYDQEQKRDALRCLALADGQEIWRFSYPISVKRNHGMSRTVPTLQSNRVVAIGPKCHVVCVDATTGELKWGLDLVQEFGTTVPPWYAGQCPLIDGQKIILAPGGPDVLLMAVALDTGQVLWKTPNPMRWKMTHSSVMPINYAEQRLYVYCASGGVVGVDSTDGTLLWSTDDWKISMATVPSPVPVGEDKLFLSGGYNAGSLMLQMRVSDGTWSAETLYRRDAKVFGATQQTPVLWNDQIYGIRPDGEFVALDLQGDVTWTSGPDSVFGLGPFLLANDLAFALDDSGQLSLFALSTTGAELLDQAQVLDGREAWAPMALTAGRLVLRDLTTMVCLDVSGEPSR